ncbi:MAG: hypothetical protein KF726_07040 [Anaerolineae bacterium]|nr:hypothetical protein [Anaerolineae bacterium]
MSSYILGVDGGNSKTIALVADSEGRIIGAGRGGCADIYGAESVEAACQAIADAVMAALSAASLTPQALDIGVFSLAGADWAEDFVFLQQAMEQRHFGKHITVVNDAIGALRAGSPDGTGVSIVCGTGTATGARNVNGQVWHTSWWQQTAGSEQLGKKTLKAVFGAELGIAPATTLTQRVLQFYDLPTVEAVLHRLTTRTELRIPERAGKLARILLEEAERSDPVAQEIVRTHGESLADHAIVAARHLKLDELSSFYLVLAGSVFRDRPSIFVNAIIERMRSELPQAVAVFNRFEPVVGAVLLALESLDVPVTEALLHALTATLPPISLFET